MTVSTIHLADDRQYTQSFRERLALNADHTVSVPRSHVVEVAPTLPPFSKINRFAKERSLTFDEALLGMIYVLAGSNHSVRAMVTDRLVDIYGTDTVTDNESLIARATVFLEGMAMRECLVGLTPEEIAGLAVGGLADCVVHLSLGCVTETCGMGADRGFGAQFSEMKTINASTLTALVLASLQVPAIKHGSYGNTSKVGSTDAVGLLGIPRTFVDYDAMMCYFREHGFLYLEAGATKTIHDLSHLIKIETVNHLVGPMSVPVSSDTLLCKVIGINHHVDPVTVVEAYNLLHKLGYQTMGGILTINGLPADCDTSSHEGLFRLTVLDEVSPFGTLVAVGSGAEYFGTCIIEDEDFGAELTRLEQIEVPNTAEGIRCANEAALTGEDLHLSRYLAKNAALALVASGKLDQRFVDDVDYRRTLLKQAFVTCFGAITSGRTWEFVQKCQAPEIN